MTVNSVFNPKKIFSFPLPTKTLFHIFSNFDPLDLVPLDLVSKNWRLLLRNKGLGQSAFDISDFSREDWRKLPTIKKVVNHILQLTRDDSQADINEVINGKAIKILQKLIKLCHPDNFRMNTTPFQYPWDMDFSHKTFLFGTYKDRPAIGLWAYGDEFLKRALYVLFENKIGSPHWQQSITLSKDSSRYNNLFLTTKFEHENIYLHQEKNWKDLLTLITTGKSHLTFSSISYKVTLSYPLEAKIPNEIMVHIFSFLSPGDLANVQQVNNRWKILGQGPAVLKIMAAKSEKKPLYLWADGIVRQMASPSIVESLWDKIQKKYSQQSCKSIDADTPDLITHSHFEDKTFLKSAKSLFFGFRCKNPDSLFFVVEQNKPRKVTLQKITYPGPRKKLTEVKDLLILTYTNGIYKVEWKNKELWDALKTLKFNDIGRRKF